MAGRVRSGLGVALLVPVLLLVAAAPAGAILRDGAAPGAGQSITTAQLQAPASASTARGLCVALLGDAIVVNWTASPSSFTDGYEVSRSLTSAGPFIAVANLGASATSYTDSGLAYSTTYYYRVKAKKVLWTSNHVQVQRTTRNSLCL